MIRIFSVHKLPKWLKKGIGVNGGGDYIGTQNIYGTDRKLYMSWKGINTSALCSAYFINSRGKWFKIRNEDVNV